MLTLYVLSFRGNINMYLHFMSLLHIAMTRAVEILPFVRQGSIYPIRKSKDYVYGIWVYKVLGIWKGYYRVKKITSFMHETVNRGKKL